MKDTGVKGLLRIENIEIGVGGDVICKNQRIVVSGIYGIAGFNNILRNALIISLTTPVAPEMDDLRFYGSISFGGRLMSYKELQQMMNPFVMFYFCESVRHTLEFVNFRQAKSMVERFDLEKICGLSIASLSVDESRRWEAAISMASGAKLIVLRGFHSTHDATTRYLSFLGEYARSSGRIVLVEVDSPLEYDLDGCILVGQSTFECINFSMESELRMYKKIHLEGFLRELAAGFSRKVEEKGGSCITALKESADPCREGQNPKPLGHIDALSTTSTTPSSMSAVQYRNGFPATSHGIGLKPWAQEIEMLKEDIVVYRVKSPKASPSARYRTPTPLGRILAGKNHWIHGLKRMLKQYFYCMDIKFSLLLTRRKYILEETEAKEFRKFIFSFLMQIYLAIILKFKTLLLNSTFESLLMIPRVVRNALEASIEWGRGIASSMEKELMDPGHVTAHNVLRIVRVLLRSLPPICRKGMMFLNQIRSYNWDLMDYKIMSTGIYFLIFTRGGTMINEERTQVYSHANRIYSPGTYFLHIFVYLILKTWIPILLISQLLNFGFALVFLITGTFICCLLNLILNLKLKYICMCATLAFNLLYPLSRENFRKSLFLRNSEPFNFLVACREFPLASAEEKPMLLYCLVRAFLFIYLFFCYRFSKLRI